MENLRSLYILFAITVTSLVIQQSSSNEIDIMKQIIFECNEKYPLSDEMKKTVKNFVFPDDQNLKCFIMCLMKSYSLIDDKGVINVEKMMMLYPDDLKPLTEELINACLTNNVYEPNICENSYKFVACGTKLNPQLITAILIFHMVFRF